MILKAKERQTGSYGTVNAGDTVEVIDSIGEELLELGSFEKASKANETASPDAVSDHNASGLDQAPIHADGTNRDILNTEGRVLHNSGPEAVTESIARAEAEVAPDVVLPTEPSEKEEKGTKGRVTKEDKSAKTEASKQA